MAKKKKNFLGRLKETMFPPNKSGIANPTYDDFKSVGTTGGSGQMSGMPTNLPTKKPGDGALASKVKPKRLPKPIVKPKRIVKPRPSQKLSAREAAELKQSGVKYEGIPEGSVPATVMPSGPPGEGLSERDKAEMGMKKGRKVKKMMGGGMMKKKGMKKGGKVRGAGIAQRGVRPAKMR